MGRGPNLSIRMPSGSVVALSRNEPMVKPKFSISSWSTQLSHSSTSSPKDELPKDTTTESFSVRKVGGHGYGGEYLDSWVHAGKQTGTVQCVLPLLIGYLHSHCKLLHRPSMSGCYSDIVGHVCDATHNLTVDAG